MASPWLGFQSLNLRTWSAFLLSLGAMFGGSARADARADPADRPAADHRDIRNGQVLVRVEGDRIFFSERGGPFQELPIADAADAASLKSLLDADAVGRDEQASVALEVGRAVVADGGSGWHRDHP